MSTLTVPSAAPKASFGAWVMAARPKTLTAAVVPVAVGTALAIHQHLFRALPALAALVGALLIQIATNFTNDYYDFKKGADTHERVGPTRVTQSGLISPETVLRAALLTFAAAMVVGLYLVMVAGWPILVIGIASVLAGYAYTGGPYPLGYHGLGDLFVFVFFGFVAVAGTFYVQALALTPAVWLVAIPVGAIGTAILVANNLRDAKTDVVAGKRTLVVRLGMTAGRAEYVLMLVLAFATPIVLWGLRWSGPGILVSLLGMGAAIPPLRRVLRDEGKALLPALAETARLQAVFGVLFSVGILLQ